MDPVNIISKYYAVDSLSFRVLLLHSQAVARKATMIATRLKLTDLEITFIQEAALLHDIGILYTEAPEIGCTGELPYICHGFMGHNLLLAEGLPKHALVCERHTGTGLTMEDIGRFGELLPSRPMEPVTLEEILITYSDKFFSKKLDRLDKEKTYEEVLESISKFGQHKKHIFAEWHRHFNL
jgi:uncharacterized protein